MHCLPPIAKEYLSCQSSNVCVAWWSSFVFISFFLKKNHSFETWCPSSLAMRLALGCNTQTTSMTHLGTKAQRAIGTVFCYQMQSLWHVCCLELLNLLSQQLLKMAGCFWKKKTPWLADFCLYKILFDAHKFWKTSAQSYNCSELQQETRIHSWVMRSSLFTKDGYN